MIVVVKVDQLAQLQVSGQRCGFRGHAFHQIAIADDAIGEMIDDAEAGPVVAGRQVRLYHCHAHAIAKTLAQRPGGHLDVGRRARGGQGLGCPIAENA